MSIVTVAIVVGLIVSGVAVYQLVKSKKAVTVGDVVSTVKSDAAKVDSAAKQAAADAKKL